MPAGFFLTLLPGFGNKICSKLKGKPTFHWVLISYFELPTSEAESCVRLIFGRYIFGPSLRKELEMEKNFCLWLKWQLSVLVIRSHLENMYRTFLNCEDDFEILAFLIYFESRQCVFNFCLLSYKPKSRIFRRNIAFYMTDPLWQFPCSRTLDNRETFEIFFVTCRLGFASFPNSLSKSVILIETPGSFWNWAQRHARVERVQCCTSLGGSRWGRFARFSVQRKGYFQRFVIGVFCCSGWRILLWEFFCPIS